MTDIQTERREPRRKSAQMPFQYEDLTVHIQTAASALSQRYSMLYDAGYARQSGESSGGNGTSKPTESALFAALPVRRQLERACKETEFAWNSIQTALSALLQAEKIMDESHPATPNVAERQRERPADRESLIEAYLVRARVIRDEADIEANRLEREARKLKTQIEQEKRAAARRSALAKVSARAANNGY